MTSLLTAWGMLAVAACSLSAGSLPFTGTLSSAGSVFEDTFTLTAADTVTVQTWGFGGGSNAAGQAILAGGFDPLIALFSGSSPTAAMAETSAIGTDNDCGDDYMQMGLPAGTCTLVLSDANYIPEAVFDNTLSRKDSWISQAGFSDPLSGCDVNRKAAIGPDACRTLRTPVSLRLSRCWAPVWRVSGALEANFRKQRTSSNTKGAAR